MSAFLQAALRALGVDRKDLTPVIRVEHRKVHAGPYRRFYVSNMPEDAAQDYQEVSWFSSAHHGDQWPNCWNDPGLVTPEENSQFHSEEDLAEFWGWPDNILTFGFNSLQQFTKWFEEEERDSLVKGNFVVCLYWVRPGFHRSGECQTVFSKLKAIRDHRVFSPMDLHAIQEALG